MAPPDPADAFAALTQRAWATNRGRATELVALVAHWRQHGEVSAERRRRVRELAHSLRGSAGTFGHAAAAAAAGQLEDVLDASGEPPVQQVAVLVAQIEDDLSREPDPVG